MGLAERIEAHQSQKDEEDRPLTEDEELAKRMAERSWAERQEEPEGLKRIKRMGKQMAPDRTSAHLASRFGARLSLLEAFRDARKQQIAKGKATPMTGMNTVATMEATMSDHQKAQIWRFFNSQTQMGLEIPFWLALDCLMQRELCGRACLGRAPLDREAWVVGKKQEKMYIVVKGSACVVEASDGGGTPSGATMATEEEATDKAMVEGPVWRKDPANDLRRASHVFGCLKVPDTVQECLTKACSDARKLRAFLLREIDRSIEFDELLVKEGFPPEIGLTRTPREGDATFLTAEEEPEPEEPPQEEFSEDEDSDDPDVIKRRDEEHADEDALSDVDHAEASRVMKALDVMSRNQRLAIVEIEAALSGFPDKAFGAFLLEQFKSLDVNSDGEIELKELAECCRRWRKIRRDKERSLERKEAKRLRREARWKQALEEQVKPEYRFGLDPCPLLLARTFVSLHATEPTRSRGQRRVDGLETPRHRADIASMARGARNLISTQV